jgi:DNA (cytosine-5)-methyltransferase 1
MDYSKLSLKKLIEHCKEKGIRSYSGKTKQELLQLLTKQTAPIIRYIDLFSGLGAFHTAFNSMPHRFECVLACDIDAGSRAIYKANYGLEPHGDIRTLDPQTIPDFEILCAGFPCQPFSIAGNGEGFNDKVKGNLFYDILKIIDTKNPPMCILENVKNLKTHDAGKTYKTIETELVKRNYSVSSEVINSADYGSPQARQRIFIVATKGKPFTIPTPTKTTSPVSTIIDLNNTKDELNRKRYLLKAKPTKTKVDPSKPHILYDIYPVLSDEKKQALELAKEELKKNGKNPESLDKGGRQGERVYSINSVGVTVCASSGGPGAKTGLYKVGEGIRRLSVKETLGMFGFPQDYKFPDVKSEDALYYLGNSIVVNVPLAFVPVIDDWFR